MSKGYFSNYKEEYIPFRDSVNRSLANLQASMDIDNKAVGNTGRFYDVFDGSNDLSSGLLDTTATTLTSAISAGNTVLTGKVASTAGFALGQEVTLYDDVGQENVRITRKESALASVSTDRSTPVDVATGLTTPATNQNGQRKITRGSDGALYICFATYISTFEQVQVKKSIDNGATWIDLSFPQVSGYNQSAPSIAIDSANNLHVVWYGLDAVDTTYPNIKYLKYNGSSWSSTLKLTTGNAYHQRFPSMAIDSSNNLHVVWGGRDATDFTPFNVKYLKFDGSSWSSILKLTSGNVYDQDYPNIVIDSTNKLHVVWYGKDASLPDYHNIRYVKHDGSSWGSIVKLTTDTGYNQQYPSISVDSVNNLHVAWYGRDLTDPNFENIRYKKYDGSSWGSVVKLTSGNLYNQIAPSIAVDGSNNLHLIWSGKDSTDTTYFNVRYIKYNGSSWGTAVKLTSGNVYDQGYPSVCMNYSNFTEPLIVWATGNGSIRFRGVFIGFADYLETTATTNAYKLGAGVARSTVTLSGGKMGFGSIAFSGTSYDRSTPVNVATGTAYANTDGTNGRKIAVAPNGTLYAAYYGNASNQQIFVYKSTDNGASWTTTSFTNFAGYTEICPSLVVDSSNNLHMIWQGYTASYPTYYNILYAKYNGTSWGSTVNVRVGALNQRTPSLEIDSNGYLHAVWYSQDTPSTIKYSKSVDDGSTWATPTSLTSTYNCTAPSIAIDSLNNLHVVWQGTNATYPTYNNIHYMKYDGAWGADTLITTGNSYSQSAPNIAIDSINNLHVVWYGQSAGNTINNIQYAKFNGTSWSSAALLTAGSTYYQYYPTISIDNLNNVHVIWLGTDSVDTATDNVKYIKYSGGAWGAIVKLTSGSTAYTYPNSCVNYHFFTQPLIVYMLSAASSTLKFRAMFSTGVTTNLLTSIARYNITPPLGTAQNFTAWVQKERAGTDANFAVAGAQSIVAVGANENFTAMTKTTTNINASSAEEAFTMSDVTANADMTLKLTLTRASTANAEKVTKVLGAIKR